MALKRRKRCLNDRGDLQTLLSLLHVLRAKAFLTEISFSLSTDPGSKVLVVVYLLDLRTILKSEGEISFLWFVSDRKFGFLRIDVKTNYCSSFLQCKEILYFREFLADCCMSSAKSKSVTQMAGCQGRISRLNLLRNASLRA